MLLCFTHSLLLLSSTNIFRRFILILNKVNKINFKAFIHYPSSTNTMPDSKKKLHICVMIIQTLSLVVQTIREHLYFFVNHFLILNIS